MKRDEDYLTPRQVSELLMASPASVRSWAVKGLLQAIKTVGGHRRFVKRDVEAFARERGISLSTKSSSLKFTKEKRSIPVIRNDRRVIRNDRRVIRDDRRQD